MSLSDLIFEPNEYAIALEFYRMSRMDPKHHLNDELAAKLIDIAEFGVYEYKEALKLADEVAMHFFEEQVTAGELDDEEDE